MDTLFLEKQHLEELISHARSELHRKPTQSSGRVPMQKPRWRHCRRRSWLRSSHSKLVKELEARIDQERTSKLNIEDLLRITQADKLPLDGAHAQALSDVQKKTAEVIAEREHYARLEKELRTMKGKHRELPASQSNSQTELEAKIAAEHDARVQLEEECEHLLAKKRNLEITRSNTKTELHENISLAAAEHARLEEALDSKVAEVAEECSARAEQEQAPDTGRVESEGY
ncbi:uncharacterized protein LAESUDRAFT_757927 [Laetiporus sulphureus 93-53]|uniref:Uncharacterized protein n=1 Tax=Laetiporus sulphureus 93-53 TaxID=1314785 RepID=A0A165F2Q0_9APHY|nr:uncharacterized protein LAESUDRAFT_757927 [Laetiporus sulphureus 93-53]KZT08248.1 hypothetical protein LAESUDRAFT_757927 [Laetiporus sulphureus 93-53]